MDSIKPNVLMIIPDQQRYDCIGYSNDYPVKTPNIDKLALQGIWFSNAYTPIPLCCPARQALLNGRRPEAFGALWNYDAALKIPALEPDEYSWTRDLQEYGYRTGYVGKWHVHPTYDPTHYGFDDYVSEYEYAVFRSKKHPGAVFSKGFIGEIDAVPLEDSRTHWLAAQAISLIERYSEEERPWHIRLDFPEPHLPCQPVAQFADMYKPEDVPMWRSFSDEFINKPYIQKQQLYNWNIQDYTWEDWAPIVARYYGIISQVDDAIGKVLDVLDEMGIAENTVVIYTPDHGDMCGGHRMMDKHYVMYEDIVKVPMIIRWPGRIRQGMVCSEFVYNFLDLPPTILEMVGLKPKEFFHGRSMLPLLRGEEVCDWRKEAVSTYNGQQFGLYTQRMIRYDNWKYIWNTTDVDELYDLEKDPNELYNLIYDESCGQVIADLRYRLYEVLLKEGDGLVKSPWLREQLLKGRKL